MNPDREIDRLRAFHHDLARACDGWEIELYHRLSRALRVREARDRELSGLLVGEEEGVALRARSRADGSTLFTACSGLDAAILQAELRRAEAGGGGPGPSATEDRLWSRELEGVRIDREGPLELPEPADLRAWVSRARQAVLEAGGSGRPMPRPSDCRLEVAVVVETWVADPGVISSRTRRRAWAMAQPEPEPDEVAPRRVVVASRRWEELPETGWRTILEDRSIGGPDEAGNLRGEALPVLFNPECSAVLVLALIKTASAPGRDSGAAVAPGWRISDDPTDPEALMGGRFDDAGFAAVPTVLWQGGRAVGRLEGPGQFRRASFRDRPVALPAHLGVEVRGTALAGRVLLVNSLSLHPLGPDRWGLEVGGAVLDDGQPTSRVRGGFISTSPSDLARRLVGAVGPRRFSHLGVKTAALVFDGLSLLGLG